MKVGPLAAVEAQRILDREARRLLQARIDADAIGTAAGADDGLLDDGADQIPASVEAEFVPVAGADGDRGRGGGE